MVPMRLVLCERKQKEVQILNTDMKNALLSNRMNLLLVSALNLFDDTCIRVVVYVWLSVCGSQRSEF